MGTPQDRPAWLRRTNGESRWLVSITVGVAITVQFLMPARYTLHPSWVLPGIETAIAVVITIFHPPGMVTRSRWIRVSSQTLLGIAALTNASSLVLLVNDITGGGKVPADQLLGGGAAIWLVNTIIFGMWYWEFDRQGPAARAAGENDQPDLLFPQMTDDHLARNWEPTLLDYLYVSFTNATAFSPTDTMPLTRWIKVLFACESAVSLITVGLVAARAVNILPG